MQISPFPSTCFRQALTRDRAANRLVPENYPEGTRGVERGERKSIMTASKLNTHTHSSWIVEERDSQPARMPECQREQHTDACIVLNPKLQEPRYRLRDPPSYITHSNIVLVLLVSSSLFHLHTIISSFHSAAKFWTE